jgi:hypothetical protein
MIFYGLKHADSTVADIITTCFNMNTLTLTHTVSYTLPYLTTDTFPGSIK